jgi:hypothetical protein
LPSKKNPARFPIHIKLDYRNASLGVWRENNIEELPPLKGNDGQDPKVFYLIWLQVMIWSTKRSQNLKLTYLRNFKNNERISDQSNKTYLEHIRIKALYWCTIWYGCLGNWFIQFSNDPFRTKNTCENVAL